MRRILGGVVGLLLGMVGLVGPSYSQALLPNGQQQFTDSNGNPLAGGTVYFYQPGTTTAKTTYQNYSLTVPNTNPVLLNSAGRATIWGSGEYREIVYDSNGNLVWDQNTYGVPATVQQGGFGAVQNIASGSTVDLGTAASHYVNVTGTAAVGSFGSSASTSTPFYLVTFSGAATLTNSSSLQLPGGYNITTNAGGSLFAVYLGSGNWQVLEYNSSLTQGFGSQQTLASAATVDLGTAGTNNVAISGTTTVSSFGADASTQAPVYVVQFTGALTLDDSGNLMLPGGANITTAAGDSLIALYLGSGEWQVLSYWKASGQPLSLTGPIATLASGTTTDLGTANANLVSITGTTNITSFGSSASVGNPLYWVTFSGALTISYNSSSLITPSGQNITTVGGDSALLQYLGSGDWKVLWFTSGASNGPAQVIESGFSAFTIGTDYTMSNTLGVVPDLVEVQLQCETANGSYATGDVVTFTASPIAGTGDNGTLWANTSTIGFSSNNDLTVINKGGGGATNITAADWEMQLVAIKFRY